VTLSEEANLYFAKMLEEDILKVLLSLNNQMYLAILEEAMLCFQTGLKRFNHSSTNSEQSKVFDNP